jgi:hypothetical protein
VRRIDRRGPQAPEQHVELVQAEMRQYGHLRCYRAESVNPLVIRWASTLFVFLAAGIITGIFASYDCLNHFPLPHTIWGSLFRTTGYYPLFYPLLKVLPFLRHAAPGPRPRHSTIPFSWSLRRVVRIMSRLTPGQASSSWLKEKDSRNRSRAASII